MAVALTGNSGRGEAKGWGPEFISLALLPAWGASERGAVLTRRASLGFKGWHLVRGGLLFAFIVIF